MIETTEPLIFYITKRGGSAFMESFNIIFADFEYTGSKNEGICDIGMVVCQGTKEKVQSGQILYYFREIDTYKAYIKSRRHLTRPVKLLTGLSDDVIQRRGIGITQALHEINKLIDAYQVEQIYVWGDDRAVFQQCMKNDNIPRNKYSLIYSLLENYEEYFSQFFGFDQKTSLQDAKTMMSIRSKVKHTAFSDAVDMKDINNKLFYLTSYSLINEYIVFLSKRNAMAKFKDWLIKNAPKDSFSDIMNLNSELFTYSKQTYLYEYLKLKQVIRREKSYE